jgi:preprotein translocase subunit SecE
VLTADRIKLVLAVLVLSAGIGVYYYLGDQSTAVRVLALLGMLAVALVVAMTSAPGRAAWAFAKESQVEMRKVVWPTRKETMQVTLIVVVMVIVLALFLWIVDWALLSAVKALTGQGA